MTTHEFNNSATQAERKQVLKDTYLTRAAAEVEMGGRFKRLNPTVITGAATSYPRQPSNSPWHSDPVPPEEPLGFSVDAMENEMPMPEVPNPPSGVGEPVASANVAAKPTGSSIKRRGW